MASRMIVKAAAAVAALAIAAVATGTAAVDYDQYHSYLYTFYTDETRTEVLDTVQGRCVDTGNDVRVVYDYHLGSEFYDSELKYYCTSSGPKDPYGDPVY